MNTKVVILISISYLYGFLEILLNLRQRSKGRIVTSGDKGSLWLLYGLITLGFTLSLSIGATRVGRIPGWDTYFAIGMILVVAGLAIRMLSIFTLRQFFTYSVARVENHSLVETGLYRVIRHPGYLGQLMILLGVSTALSNWISILGMMLPVTIGFFYRMNVEERFMLEQLGEPYSNYRERTKRLIPMIY